MGYYGYSYIQQCCDDTVSATAMLGTSHCDEDDASLVVSQDMFSDGDCTDDTLFEVKCNSAFSMHSMVLMSMAATFIASLFQ